MGRLILAYVSEAAGLLMLSSWVFNYDVASMGQPANPPSREILILLLPALGVLAIFIFSERMPKKIKAGLSIALVGSLLFWGREELLDKKQFDVLALFMWFIAVGIVILLEMRSRGWKRRLGYWPGGVMMYLAAMSIFASNYYSHIKASFGGGALIPIQVTFTSNFPPMPGQTLGCMLIDETDAGLYVTGRNEGHATFIPRSSVAVVHFAGSSEASIFASKAR
jgi:hypothetical protein